VADSVLIGSATVLSGLLSAFGTLRLLGPLGDTAAFLAYFIWPITCVCLVVVGVAAALRDWKRDRAAQAAFGVILCGYALAFTATRFAGWE
jgi:hypothetical protein